MLRITDKHGETTELHMTLVQRMWPSIYCILTLDNSNTIKMRTVTKRAILNMAHFYTDPHHDTDLAQLDKPASAVMERLQLLATWDLATWDHKHKMPLVYARYLRLPDDEKVDLHILARITNNMPLINLFTAYFLSLARESATKCSSVFYSLLRAASLV